MSDKQDKNVDQTRRSPPMQGSRPRQGSLISDRSNGSTQGLQGSFRNRRVTYDTGGDNLVADDQRSLDSTQLNAADMNPALQQRQSPESGRPNSRTSRLRFTGSNSDVLATVGPTISSNQRLRDEEHHQHHSYENGYADLDAIERATPTLTNGYQSNRSTPVSSSSNQHHQHHHHHKHNRHRRSSSRDNLIEHIKQAPPDKYKLVFFGFTILGITTLLPWNFFITATDYWMFKFRNITDTDYNASEPHTNQRTPMQTFFESYLAIAANVPMLFSMLINSLYGQRFSQKKRLYVSLSVMLIIFTLTTIFVKLNTDQMQTSFFALTMLLVVIISFFSATFQAAIFGIVANFPNNCMHAMVTGQAAAGLLAVSIQIFSMLNNTGPIMSGLWYFLASTIFLAFAIICYWLMDNDYSRYYLLRIPDEDELSTSISVNLLESKWELLEAFEDCWQMAASVVLAFWASLAVFPGVCVLVVPEYPNSDIFTGRFFVPLTTFLLFNLGDLIGRMCSSYLPFPMHKKNGLLALTISRAFVPLLILFCNVTPRYYTPILFTSDVYFPIFVSVTSLTNGYIFSSAMVMASVCSQRTRLELTGFVMASALGTGLMLGSISSTLLLRVI